MYYFNKLNGQEKIEENRWRMKNVLIESVPVIDILFICPLSVSVQKTKEWVNLLPRTHNLSNY